MVPNTEDENDPSPQELTSATRSIGQQNLSNKQGNNSNYCHTETNYVPDHLIYDNSFYPPFLILMESTTPGKNLVRMDPTTIGKIMSKYITRDIKIYVSEQNQIKIQCDSKEDANKMLLSEKLFKLGYKTFIPESTYSKKGFTRADPMYTVPEVVGYMDEKTRDILISAKRRLQRGSNNPINIINLHFRTKSILRLMFIYQVAHTITPIIPPPKRLFKYQAFGHVQCRAPHFTCEYCGEGHDSDGCESTSTFRKSKKPICYF